MKKIKYFLLPLIFLGASIITNSQDLKNDLFKDANDRINKARISSVDLMSPSNFNKAYENYKNAEADFKDGASLSDIKEQIAEVNSYLDKAFKTAEVGQVTFATVLKARNDAMTVSAATNVPTLWQKAEVKLKEAGEELEDGNVNDVRKTAVVAEKLFRDAELEAIKTSYLVVTRNKIKLAEDKNVRKTAPETLALSKKLVNQSEKELNDNRYDTDKPRSLAMQAQYEIDHALYIDNAVNYFNDKDESLEKIILSSEKEMSKVASVLEVDPAYDKGLAPVADELVEKAKVLMKENEKSKETISNLENEVKILKEELSGLSAEKSELASKMDKLNIIKEKYTAVDKIFTDEEAQVLRKENDIIIRLVGLSFDVGQAVIKPQSFGLLTRLQKAIKEFPEGKISIEGYTDSFGSDASNLNLSQQRADAVTEYLLANMDISRSRIISVGYGETKPIANNETAEGRAKNRRIDLVIKNN